MDKTNYPPTPLGRGCDEVTTEALAKEWILGAGRSGKVSEIHGPDADEFPAFRPMRVELAALAVHWANMRVGILRGHYCCDCARLDLFAELRLRQIGALLGEGALYNAVRGVMDHEFGLTERHTPLPLPTDPAVPAGIEPDSAHLEVDYSL